jgi:hypothetical protein
LNAQLAHYLEKHPYAPIPTHATTSLPSYHRPLWRVRDRLSAQDIADIIRAFKSGTAKHILAKRYGINERSLKKLLREEGVRRK